MPLPINRRILLIDDTPAIHDDFRKILTPGTGDSTDLDTVESTLFGSVPKTPATVFELTSAYGGQEGLGKLLEAAGKEQPYALAFVDMRMPDGWDGAQTIEELWKHDRLLQVVACTAYTDYSWNELLDRLNGHDRLLILKKPFDNIEVQQMANTLTTIWEMTSRAQLQISQLEELVEQRTQALKLASAALQKEIDERKRLEKN
ncbi:CheY-like chemotaxis protein [Pseudomonas sp. S30_BP2TU TE3576]